MGLVPSGAPFYMPGARCNNICGIKSNPTQEILAGFKSYTCYHWLCDLGQVPFPLWSWFPCRHPGPHKLRSPRGSGPSYSLSQERTPRFPQFPVRGLPGCCLPSLPDGELTPSQSIRLHRWLPEPHRKGAWTGRPDFLGSRLASHHTSHVTHLAAPQFSHLRKGVIYLTGFLMIYGSTAPP